MEESSVFADTWNKQTPFGKFYNHETEALEHLGQSQGPGARCGPPRDYNQPARLFHISDVILRC